MAMSTGGDSGGLNSNINVTPLVDVMLVLLIIMMLIAPMLQQGVAVTLPEAGNTGDKPDTQDQTVVAIDSRGKDLRQRHPRGPRRPGAPGAARPRGQEGKDRLPQG
jgi:biopolymer transport protein TolR